jgi:hypothetical protein
MAYTVSIRKQTVHGNQRSVQLLITADAATQTVQTGLQYIDAHAVGAQSLSTAAIKVFANAGAEGTSTAGALGISGCVNGDSFFVTVFGR